MIAATLNGQSCWIAAYSPNTDDEVEIKALIDVDGQRRLTGRRSGRPQAQLLRYKMTWRRTMTLQDFSAARTASPRSGRQSAR